MIINDCVIALCIYHTILFNHYFRVYSFYSFICFLFYFIFLNHWSCFIYSFFSLCISLLVISIDFLQVQSLFFYCCSSTVVSIFPPSLSPAPSTPTSHPQSYPPLGLSVGPLYMFIFEWLDTTKHSATDGTITQYIHY